jgi:hypothetical protein
MEFIGFALASDTSLTHIRLTQVDDRLNEAADKNYGQKFTKFVLWLGKA